MLQQSIPDSHRAAAEELARLTQGHRVTVVPGFEPVPRPKRWHPEPKPKPVAPALASDLKRMADMEELKGYALKGYTLRYARRCMGINDYRAEQLAKDLLDFGIEFREPPKRKPE